VRTPRPTAPLGVIPPEIFEADPDALPVLVELLPSPDPLVAYTAYCALRKYGSRGHSAISALEALLTHKHPDVRRNAAAAIEAIRKDDRRDFTREENWKVVDATGAPVIKR
jgi:HEAT repeat protein